MAKTLEQRTENYMFTSDNPNDSRLIELKRLVKGTGYRTKRVGRTPKPGQKWRSGWLPLFASQKFDVYLYPTDKERVERFKLLTYMDWVTLKSMEKVLFETFRMECVKV
jgi:hypothetical protein